MKVRKLGEGSWLEVAPPADGDCLFCELARGSLKRAGEVIYFETDAGAVQRTECVGVASDGSAGFLCWESSRAEAANEFKAFTCGTCFAPPGVECNATSWCGAVEAGPHERMPLENPCEACRGTGRYGTDLGTCPHCNGKRHAK